MRRSRLRSLIAAGTLGSLLAVGGYLLSDVRSTANAGEAPVAASPVASSGIVDPVAAATAGRAALSAIDQEALASWATVAGRMNDLSRAWIACVAANGGAVTGSADGMTGIDETDSTRKACAEEHAAIGSYESDPAYVAGVQASQRSIVIGWQCVADSGYLVSGFASRSAAQPKSGDLADPAYLETANRCGVPIAGS